MKNLLYIFVLSSFIFISCNKDKDMLNTTLHETIDTNGTSIISHGDFIDLGSGHELSGKAFIIVDSVKNKFLRFENLSVKNGPDVNVYLAKSPAFKDVIDLGDLKSTNGEVNYDFDDSLNTAEYKFALIWCKKYAVLFGYAELKK